MTKLMPQELAVWYLIPAIRRELAKAMLKDKFMTQKRAAGLLGLTEAAVSQYMKSKRAKELKLLPEEKRIVAEYAIMIRGDPENCNRHLYALTQKLMGGKSMCALHKKEDKSIPRNCKICISA